MDDRNSADASDNLAARLRSRARVTDIEFNSTFQRGFRAAFNDSTNHPLASRGTNIDTKVWSPARSQSYSLLRGLFKLNQVMQ